MAARGCGVIFKESGGPGSNQPLQTVMTALLTHEWTNTFTDPDGYDHHSPQKYQFAIFCMNWRKEWELRTFTTTLKDANAVISEMIVNGWTKNQLTVVSAV